MMGKQLEYKYLVQVNEKVSPDEYRSADKGLKMLMEDTGDGYYLLSMEFGRFTHPKLAEMFGNMLYNSTVKEKLDKYSVDVLEVEEVEKKVLKKYGDDE